MVVVALNIRGHADGYGYGPLPVNHHGPRSGPMVVVVVVVVVVAVVLVRVVVVAVVVPWWWVIVFWCRLVHLVALVL